METFKICNICKQSKLINEFGLRKNSVDGHNGKCKSCEYEYHKLYRKQNKESLCEKKKLYYENNKEHIIEKSKIFRENNKDKIYETRKIYLSRNKKRIANVMKNYYESNKQSIFENIKIYKQTESCKISKRNYLNKRRFLKKISSDGTIPLRYSYPLTSELNQLIVSQNYKCKYCDCHLTLDTNTHLDHIVPLSRGGIHSIVNVQWLCSSCNLKKSSMSESDFLNKIG